MIMHLAIVFGMFAMAVGTMFTLGLSSKRKYQALKARTADSASSQEAAPAA